MWCLVAHSGWERDQDASHCADRVEPDSQKDVEEVEAEACLAIDRQLAVDLRRSWHAGLAERVAQRRMVNERDTEKTTAVEYVAQETLLRAAGMKHLVEVETIWMAVISGRPPRAEDLGRHPVTHVSILARK